MVKHPRDRGNLLFYMMDIALPLLRLLERCCYGMSHVDSIFEKFGEKFGEKLEMPFASIILVDTNRAGIFSRSI